MLIIAAVVSILLALVIVSMVIFLQCVNSILGPLLLKPSMIISCGA